MSGVNELLDRLAEIGATIRSAGDHLILRAGPKPVPAALVKRLHRAKAQVLAVISPAARYWGQVGGAAFAASRR
jgi:hypothetical protein